MKKKDGQHMPASKNTPAATNDGGVAFIRALARFLDDYADSAEGAAPAAPVEEATKAPAKKAAAPKKAPVPEPDEVAGEEITREVREAELKKLRITSLKKQAKEAGFPADEIDGASKEEIVEALLDDEFEDPEEDEEPEEVKPAPKKRAARSKKPDPEPEPEEDDEDDEDEEGDEYDRPTLTKMGLRELKRIAKEAGAEPDDLKGADKATLIDFILDDGDDEDEEEDDDEDDEFLTEEDLKEMSLSELRATAKEYGVKVPKGSGKDDIIDLLLDEAEDDD